MPQAPSSPPAQAPGHVLVVDDDADILKAARLVLSRQGLKVSTAGDPAEAWSALAADPADVVLLDLNFSRAETSGEGGFRWLSELIAHDPEAVVVVITGHSGVNIAVAAMRAGASDFVMKPWRNDRLVATIETALELRRRRRQGPGGTAPADGDTPGALVPILGDGPAMRRVRSLISRVAATDASVLIFGAAGTGKSLIARTIHHQSPRASAAFVALDLEALERADLGQQLTGGLKAASGGTLCLEEVGSLSRSAQGEVVSMLEAARNVRLLATTRRRRDQLAGPLGLGDDLIYRLNTLEIAVPPLRQREGDALLLAEHFLRLFAARYDRRLLPLSPEAARVIGERDWPGEVRALRQAMERCVIFAEGERYEVLDVAGEATFQPATATASAGLNLAATERTLIARALEANAFNVSHAARQLGLTRAALYRRMAKHGL